MNWTVYFLTRLPDLIKAFISIANWWDIPVFFLRPTPTIFKFRHGPDLILSQVFDFWVYQEIFISHDYDFKATGKTQTVIDIGGHLGMFSIFAGRQSDKISIFAFEPSVTSFRLLKDNVKLNHLESRVIPSQLAVFDHDRGASFYLSNTSAKRSLISQSPHSRALTVPTLTLSQIFSRFRIKSCDFLKMDCEGSEYAILESTPPEILAKIKSLVIEFHQFLPSQSPKNLTKILEKNKFTVSFNYPYQGSKSGYIYAYK